MNCIPSSPSTHTHVSSLTSPPPTMQPRSSSSSSSTTISKAHHDRITAQLYTKLEANTLELERKDNLIANLDSQLHHQARQLRTTQAQEQTLQALREEVKTKDEHLELLRAQSDHRTDVLEEEIEELKTELAVARTHLRIAKLEEKGVGNT